MRLGPPARACLFVAAAAVPASAQTPWVSVERVRAALLRPATKLVLEYRQPDFTIHIQEQRLDDVFDTPLWDTPAIAGPRPSMLAHIEGTPGSTPPLVQVNVNPSNLARTAMRTVKARAVRTQTERAITRFCAGQPDAGASIPLCWSYSSTSSP